MVAAMSSLASEAAQLARLSPRQREVLEALARTGAPTRRLAEQLGMSYRSPTTAR
jgi:FixJ family two-component response regulator